MQISKQTFEIMKNFTSINNSIWVNEESVLKTQSIAENIIGVYDTEEKFPEWQLYNSVPFMSLVQMLELGKVDFDFGDKAVVIKAKGARCTIVYNSTDLIPKLGDLKESASYKKYDKFNASFTLASDKVSYVQKVANILGLPDMTVTMRDGKGIISIIDNEDPNSNTFKIAITGEGDCDITMMVKNLLVIPSDYTVSVSDGILSRFQHSELPLFYIVAAKKE